MRRGREDHLLPTKPRVLGDQDTPGLQGTKVRGNQGAGVTDVAAAIGY